MTELAKPLPVARPRRSTLTSMDDAEISELDELTTKHTLIGIARAADVSVQSLAKALARKPLFESTKRRLRTVLRKKTA